MRGILKLTLAVFALLLVVPGMLSAQASAAPGRLTRPICMP